MHESLDQRAPLREALDWVEEQEYLDVLARPLQRAVRALPLGEARAFIRGSWLGHPVHPALVQVPIGSWTSAAVLDLVPGEGKAAAGMVALGLLGAAPAVAAGLVDWAEQDPRQLRVGVVHAAANTVGVAFYTASLVARLRGRPWAGRAWGFAGLTVATVGGILGGHLAYRQARSTDIDHPDGA
jgi:uncharacterized membrane protein